MFDDSTLIRLLLPAVTEAVDQASEAVMTIYGSDDVGLEYKTDHSPVTAADLAANRIIINALGELTPNIPVISEESLESLAAIAEKSTYWLVDPVDGTKEFLSHNGEFTVNVALIVDRVPVLGVVAAPALGLLYSGCHAGAAYRRSAGQEPQAIRVATAGTALTAAVSRSHLDDATANWLKEHGVTASKAVGSSLKICYVADGTVNVCPRLGPQHEWDIAAADAVLRAAGGGVYLAGTGALFQYGQPAELTPHYVATGDASLITA